MTLTKEEREELICILTLQTNYSEDYLSSITDEELLALANRNMNGDCDR